jgi:hypothetical protein
MHIGVLCNWQTDRYGIQSCTNEVTIFSVLKNGRASCFLFLVICFTEKRKKDYAYSKHLNFWACFQESDQWNFTDFQVSFRDLYRGFKSLIVMLLLLFLLLWWGETMSVELWLLLGHCPSSTWYMSEYGASVEWYWQKIGGLEGGGLVPVPFCLPQIPHGLLWKWIQTFVVRSRWLTTCPMALPR